MPTCRAVVFFCMRGRWKTRGRVTGSRGVENTKKPLFRSMNFPHQHEKSKFVISNWKENQLASNAFLDHESPLAILGEKNHSNANVQCNGFLLYVVSFSFFTVTCVNLVLTLKNCEILKIVLLSLPWKATVAVFARLKAGYLKRALTTRNNKHITYAWPCRAEFQKKAKVGYKWRKCSNHVEIPVPKYFLVFFRIKETSTQYCSCMR